MKNFINNCYDPSFRHHLKVCLNKFIIVLFFLKSFFLTAQLYINKEAIIYGDYSESPHEFPKDSLHFQVSDTEIYATEGTVVIGLDSSISINLIRSNPKIGSKSLKTLAAKKQITQKINDDKIKPISYDFSEIKAEPLDGSKRILKKMADQSQAICSNTNMPKMIISQIDIFIIFPEIFIEHLYLVNDEDEDYKNECYLSIRPPPYQYSTIGQVKNS